MINKTDYKHLLSRPEWKVRRLQIIERDNGKCTKCGSEDNLHVHHLKYGYEYPWCNPDEDLITLCGACHNTEHTSDTVETFGMHRTTEGVSWILNFTGIEIHMMVVLTELENTATDMVSLTPLVKKHLADKFDKTPRYIREVIASLEAKDALIRVTTQDLVLNPSYFYKGGTKTFKNKMLMYSKFKSEKRTIL